MARFLHWFGVLLLFVSACLLLVTTISAPVIGDIAILKVMLTNQTDIRHSSVTFGSFGHCILDVPPVTTDQDWCSKKSIGYKPADIMSAIDGTNFNVAAAGSVDVLTNAMVLHPIALALTLIALITACLPSFVGAILGAAMTGLAWIITLVIMAIDFAIFGVIKNHVNKDGSGNHAFYSVGMWTCLAAMILLFFAMFIVLFSCFQSRKKRRNGGAHNTKTDTYGNEKRSWFASRRHRGSSTQGVTGNGTSRRHY